MTHLTQNQCLLGFATVVSTLYTMLSTDCVDNINGKCPLNVLQKQGDKKL